MLYSLYQFIDDGPDGPEDAPFIGPVPTFDIATIQADAIPRAERLLELMANMSTPNAFCVWASETLGEFEAKRKYVERVDLDDLESARVRYEDAINDLKARASASGERGLGWSDLQPQLREILCPFVEQRLSMRQTANYLGASLRDIVLVQAGGASANNAERVCDLEEQLLDGALERMSQRELLFSYGSQDFNLLKRLCTVHGIDAKAQAATRKEAA